MNPRPLDVVAGVIVRSRRVLLARRLPGGAHGGLWEFPGGKVEPGEAPRAALRRELAEELGVAVAVGRPLPEVLWTYPFRTLRLMPFWCRLAPGVEPRPLECAELRWAAPAELSDFPMPEADDPVAAFLRRAARRGA